MDNTCIICVNYNTPELIEKLIKSYYEYSYDKYPLFIVDGSDDEILKNKSLEIYKKYSIEYDFVGYNIHHGPGLDYLINKLDYMYYLTIDSDAYFIKGGLIDNILPLIKNKYGIGNIVNINERGFNIKNGIKYLHPRCSFINKEQYLKYKPYKKHGAPSIDPMVELHHLKLSHRLLVEYGVLEYVNEDNRGTVNKFGYNL